MKYIIHAMEKETKGQYGIDRWALVDLKNFDSVIEYAYQVCMELMIDYSTIDKQIQKEAAAKAKKQKDFSVEEIKSQIYHDRALFHIYQVDEEKYPTLKSMSREYLKDKGKFAAEQCKRII